MKLLSILFMVVIKSGTPLNGSAEPDVAQLKRLDSWHWVTIISLEYVLDGSIAILSILDGGTIKKVDLAQWFNTTALGGGFVSFDFKYK